MKIKKYLRIWFLMALKVSQVQLASRFGGILIIIGKFLRFFLFLIFLFLISSRVEKVGGYSVWQMVFFYATFNLLDTLPQFFFRDVYNFRRYITSGYFDYHLIRPISPLFRSLLGGADILDIPILLMAIGGIFVAISHMSTFSFTHIGLYLLLLCNGFLIATAFHIFILAIGILATEIDSALWLYRDVTLMGRIPVDIYAEPIRSIITFIIPVGVMMTVPAKALMGLLSIQAVLVALFIGLMFFFSSIWFWQFSLRRYTSASS